MICELMNRWTASPPSLSLATDRRACSKDDNDDEATHGDDVECYHEL